MKPKISVVIITFNQQDCIVNALDSLICQKEWIYEIIVSDDCSKDNTWQVVVDYAKNYSDFIKPFQNEKNLGIYGNMLAGYKRASGNVISHLSGDDIFLPGCCEKAYKYLESSNILDKCFTLYMNRRRHFADRRPDYTFNNHLAVSERRMSYALRKNICEESFFSPKILNRCVPPTDLGKCGDIYWCLSEMYYSDIVLYLDSNSVQYNAGIGVSVTASLRKTRESELLVYGKILRDNELKFGHHDLQYVKYQLCKSESYFNPSIYYLFRSTCEFLKSIDFSLGIRYIGFFEHLKYIFRYIPYMVGLKRI